jgi:hypothetical protein
MVTVLDEVSKYAPDGERCWRQLGKKRSYPVVKCMAIRRNVIITHGYPAPSSRTINDISGIEYL